MEGCTVFVNYYVCPSIMYATKYVYPLCIYDCFLCGLFCQLQHVVGVGCSFENESQNYDELIVMTL